MTNTKVEQFNIKQYLSYYPFSGIFIWKNRPANSIKKNSEAGSLKNNGYIVIQFKNKVYLAHRLAFFYMNGRWPIDQLDHINHIKNDNRAVNLREVTNKENSKNRSLAKNSSSLISGVTFCKTKNKWIARINCAKRISLGVFDDFFEACCARKGAEIVYSYHENHGISYDKH